MGRGGNAKAARLERAFSLPGLTGNIPSAEPSQQEHPLMLPDAENKLMVARGGRGGGRGEKGKGLSSTHWQLRNSRGDVEDSTGNAVNDVVKTLCGVRSASD